MGPVPVEQVAHAVQVRPGTSTQGSAFKLRHRAMDLERQGRRVGANQGLETARFGPGSYFSFSHCLENGPRPERQPVT